MFSSPSSCSNLSPLSLPDALPISGDLAADGGILHRAPAAHIKRLIQVLVQGRTNDQPLGRNSAHQVVELALDGFHVLEISALLDFRLVRIRVFGRLRINFERLAEEGPVELL